MAIANEEKQGYNGRWKIQVFDADEFFMVASTWTVDATPTGVWARSNAFGPMFRLAKPTGCLRILREENVEDYLVEGQYPRGSGGRSWQSQVLASFPWTAQQLGQADANLSATIILCLNTRQDEIKGLIL